MAVLKNKPHVHLRYQDPEKKGDYYLTIVVKLPDRTIMREPYVDEELNVRIEVSAEKEGEGENPVLVERSIAYPKPPPTEPTEFEVQVWGQTENPGDNLLGKAKIKYEPSEDPDMP